MSRWFGVKALQAFFRISAEQAKQAIEILHGSMIIEQDPETPWKYRFVERSNLSAIEAINKIREFSDKNGTDPLILLEEIRRDD